MPTQRRLDATGKPRIYSLQRVGASLRMLCYGIAVDAFNAYVQMSEDSIILSVKAFCHFVVVVFAEEYVHESMEEDLCRIIRINATRGFHGCIGSIAC